MKKKFLVFMTILLVLLVGLTIVACNDYPEPEPDPEQTSDITRTQVITNGTFYNASSSATDAYVMETVNGWSATKGSLATNANGVTMGVIDLANAAAYELNKDKFSVEGVTDFNKPAVDSATPYDTDDNGNPTTELQDTNALVIASKSTEGSLYYKNSSFFTLTAGKYYLLQYSVCTVVDKSDASSADKKGAWVHVTGGVEYLDKCIETNGEWVTRYLYIETGKNSNTTIDVRLWLGNGPEKINNVANPYATRGAAMFDNIICKEITSAKNTADQEVALDHDSFNTVAGNKVSAYYLSDLALEQTTETTPTSSSAINYFYSFREGVYTSTNMKNYTLVKGKEDIDSADQPTVTNAFVGIVDLAKLYADGATSTSTDAYSAILPSSYKFSAPSYDDWTAKIMNGAHNVSELGETKAMMIYHSDLSGAGLTNKTVLKIEKGKRYEISVWVYVWAPYKDDAFVWPTANAPTKPNNNADRYTAKEQLLIDYYNNGGSFVGYFNDLNAGETAIVASEPASITDKATIDALVTNDIIDAAYGATTDDQKIVARYFKFKYLYDHFDAEYLNDELVEDDREYVTYKYLVERRDFLKNTWAPVKTLMDKWDKYDTDYLDYMAKYNTWLGANPDGPHATVKLSGAGDDIEKSTVSFNTGWEKLTFYIEGNQLSDRNVTLEFWFGEGTATEYEDLMFGGAFFDNISIVERGNEFVADWQTLTPISDVDELDFGGLINNEDVNAYWSTELAEGVATSDAAYVTLGVNANIGAVTLPAPIGEVTLNELVLTHTEATASVLNCIDAPLTIKPNTAYRFAVWTRTELEEGQTVTISLMAGKDADNMSAVTSVSSFASEDSKEIAFYILGDALETNVVSLRVTAGSGNRFSTDNYVKGKVCLSIINCAEIEYSEYTASKSGDEIKSYSFSNTSAASDSVTNGNFSAINYSSTDEKEFDENGVLTGVATTSSWTAASAIKNTFNKPTLSYDSVSGRLKWTEVKGVDYNGGNTEPSYYEVYARFDEDGKTVERLYKNIQSGDGTYMESSTGYYVDVDGDLDGKTVTKFRVRAVSAQAVSDFSSYVTPAIANPGDAVLVTEAQEAATIAATTAKKEYKAGTILNEGIFAGSDYVSPYKTSMVITSNYAVALKETAASKSLSALSYYRVSVWVKTVGTAEASITVSNISDVLTANVDENYIGFVKQNTNDQWKEYVFYIKTGNSDTSLTLELSLGNPYAVKASKTSAYVTTAVATYRAEDLSMGTVYFDGVRVLSIDEKEYNKELAKGEKDQYGNVKEHSFDHIYLNNVYVFRNLVYTTDSFDSFTANTTAEGTDGYNLGNTPNNYAWAKASDANGDTEAQRLYGVYNYDKDVDKLEQLYTADDNVFASFMPAGFDVAKFVKVDGYNSLVMSNKTLYGQSYTTDSTAAINAGSYYKLTFKAKTLIAKENKDDGDADNVTYTTDGVNAEFRFMQNGTTDTYQSVLINSKGGDIYEAKEYTLYVYNPSASASNAKWSFVLGDNNNEDDTTGVKQLVIGMMVVDQVSLEVVNKTVYDEASAAYSALTESEKINASTVVYSYDEDKKDDTEDDKDDEAEEEKKKDSIWDKGEAWLLISSIVIAVVILIVVIVLIVRRWKKKHPREVVVENVSNPEKEIKVVTTDNSKVEVAEDDEYSDAMPERTVTFNQRVVRKGKNNKKKK